jgi:hypothetical protein
MASYLLTVGNISEIYMGADKAKVTFGTAEFYVTMENFRFTKQIFAPGEMHTVLSVKAVDNSTTTYPSLSDLQNAFFRQKVSLKELLRGGSRPIDENYFVFKMKPSRSKTSDGSATMKVELFIYSMDKLMTIDKYCNAFTAKRLGEDIFKGELNKFWLDSNNQLQGEVNMQMLAFKNKNTKEASEVRQPYLVQYNETFYDFLARSAIRCGEMLYFEGGSLHLGMKPDLTKASTDQSTVADTVDYEDCIEKVLAVQDRHYNFFNRSSDDDNRYIDSAYELVGAKKEKMDASKKSSIKKSGKSTTVGTKEEGRVTKTTEYAFERGKITKEENTTYYMTTDDYPNSLWAGEPKETVITITVSDIGNNVIWKQTKTLTHIYQREKNNKINKFVGVSALEVQGQKVQAVYNQPEPNDAVFEELEKDGYTNFSNESFDYRLMLLNLLFSVLNNTNLYDILSDLAWSVAQTAKDAGVSMKKKNDQNNDKNLTLDKTNNPEQTDGTIFNLFSTLKSIIDESDLNVNKKGDTVSLLMADFYAKMRRASQSVSQMLVRLNYGERGMDLCLGDVINVEGRFYVVIKVEMDENNYIVEAIPPFYKKVSTDNTTITEAIPCPPLMPEIPTVRTAEAQVAFVEDNLDPNRFGRVRVRYPWQPANGDQSPWIRMATPFATAGGGVTFRPCTGDEVLLNYEDGNIERPYIVGSLQSRYVTDPWLPLPDRVIRSKNGHSITFNDSTDGANFLWGLLPGSSLIKSCVPIYDPLIKDQNMVDLTGGINITDRYGLYQINMSSDKRTVNIASPLGNISLNAFTGITISAPNGNVKIEGKNVSIAASNKLTLTSGSGINDRWFPLTKEGWKDWGKGLITDVADRTVGKLIDFSFFRTILEVFTRPVDGTLKIKSNTYVLIEAGNGSAQVPYDDYKHPTIERIKSPIQNFVTQGILLGKLKKTIDMLTSKVDNWGKDFFEVYKNAYEIALSYQHMKCGSDVLYDKLNNMKIGDIVSKVKDNKEKSPFDITTIITKEDFDFDNIDYFKLSLEEGEEFQNLEQKEDEEPKIYEARNKVAKTAYLYNQMTDQLFVVKLRRKLIETARDLGNAIKILYDFMKLWKEFDFTKKEKEDCFTSEGLRDEFRDLDFDNGLFSNLKNGTVSFEEIDIKKQLTIWKRKMVYKLISEVKDEQYYAEFFGVDSMTEPKDYSDDDAWKAFTDKIGEPTFTPGKALTAGRAIRRPFKSYLWDGKASEWLNSFTCHHRWKAAENGKVLISDKAGETICFDKGLPTINHSYGTGNNAYYLELRKKVNEVG